MGDSCDYDTAMNGFQSGFHVIMLMMAGAIEWILDMQQKLAAQEKTEDKIEEKEENTVSDAT
jgi:hypothetical protein